MDLRPLLKSFRLREWTRMFWLSGIVDVVVFFVDRTRPSKQLSTAFVARILKVQARRGRDARATVADSLPLTISHFVTAAGTAATAGADATVAVGALLPPRLSPHGTASPGSPFSTN